MLSPGRVAALGSMGPVSLPAPAACSPCSILDVAVQWTLSQKEEMVNLKEFCGNSEKGTREAWYVGSCFSATLMWSYNLKTKTKQQFLNLS